MHDNSALVRSRIERFIRERVRPAVYRARRPLSVAAWMAPGEPVAFGEAVRQRYEPLAVGMDWGRAWSTVWFHVTGAVPDEWDETGLHPELIVDLGFNQPYPGFQAEGTIYSADGVVLKAVQPRNRHVLLPGGPGADVDVYVEAAANPEIGGSWDFTPTPFGDPATAPAEPLFRLHEVTAGLLDTAVWELLQDMVTLTGLVDELPDGSTRRAIILRALERAVDAMDPGDVAGTAQSGRDLLRPVLENPAAASAHRVMAVGHAHIDSAWLWPTRETKRKVARTFSNVLSLMETDEDFVFAASSAQHYKWLKETQPELFERVRARVAEGRFVPVGGMWVESDTNLPGGEALVRQLVAGTKFFREEFGVEQPEVWLPDSFGYSGALPQILRAAGARWFLTQKTSWNETNRLPHHTFWWEGIDGSRIFTHFPPSDTYGAEISAKELARGERQYAEKGHANTSLMLFGWGDGGGGPTREMLAAAARTADLEGSPRVELTGPRRFFEAAQNEYADAPVWSGELYLEFHRGTYTTQARTKHGNRRSEHLLREAELWATTAAVRSGLDYPYDALQSAWHAVLLYQFHDILPGTSISWVHQEAERRYAEVAADLESIIGQALKHLTGDGNRVLRANAGPRISDGVAAMGVGEAVRTADVTIADRRDEIVMSNSHIRVHVDRRGLISSLFDLTADREIIPAGQTANLLQIFRDTPTNYDAWDIDAHYQHNGTDLTQCDEVSVVEESGVHAVRIRRTVGSSSIEQRLSLRADSPTVEIRTDVDWHERQKLLKVAFPVDVHTDRATSEIQFGHIHRPTHVNTTWDAARFETSGHRWIHVGETGYGVALANDSSYGHDITRHPKEGGGTTSLLRLSLLRAPLFPDPGADQGPHSFTVALRVGAGINDAISEGYRLNLPPRTVTGNHDLAPLIGVDNSSVIVEAVKLAEDRSGDVIVRLYEALGGRAKARMDVDFDFTEVIETDLHEQELADGTALVDTNGVQLKLRPFQLVTLRVRR